MTNIKLTHPQRIIFPKPKLTKEDLFNYYDEISDYILPYLKDRLISVVRCPQDINECFFQRHENINSEFIHEINVELKDKMRPYIYIKDKNGLLTLAQFGVVEIHIWGSKIKKVHNPDLMVFDLDPSEELPWQRVVTAAADLKLRLDKLGLQSFLKTTGGKGLHVAVPIQPQYDFAQIKQFTKNFALKMEKAEPQDYIVNMNKEKRKGKIFIDYLRNEFSATSITPYSARSREDATIAMPLSWGDLDFKLDPKKFTITSAPKYLQKRKSDPWQDFFKTKQKLSKALLKDFEVVV